MYLYSVQNVTHNWLIRDNNGKRIKLTLRTFFPIDEPKLKFWAPPKTIPCILLCWCCVCVCVCGGHWFLLHAALAKFLLHSTCIWSAAAFHWVTHNPSHHCRTRTTSTSHAQAFISYCEWYEPLFVCVLAVILHYTVFANAFISHLALWEVISSFQSVVLNVKGKINASDKHETSASLCFQTTSSLIHEVSGNVSYALHWSEPLLICRAWQLHLKHDGEFHECLWGRKLKH